MFQRVALINLRSRPDRLAQFFGQPQMADWPFVRPTVYDATDGFAGGRPATWTSGSGSWGCCKSHLKVLRAALDDGIETLLVLEDDALLCPNFAPRIKLFFETVPGWDLAMIGGQHRNNSGKQVAPGIIKCVNCQRTHAMGIRGVMIQRMYDLWSSMTTGHIDHRLGPWAADYRTYAPDPFLIGQASGKSDISRKTEKDRFWSKTHYAEPGIRGTGRSKHRHITNYVQATLPAVPEAATAAADRD